LAKAHTRKSPEAKLDENLEITPITIKELLTNGRKQEQL
jgi:hypothetical protein